jgi:translocation and assembly module TamA
MVTGSVEWQRPITVRQPLRLGADRVRGRRQRGRQTQPDDGLHRRGHRHPLGQPGGPGQADIAWGIKTQQFRLHLRMGFTF